MSGTERNLCVIGDVHGHLQLSLCMAAAWQDPAGFEAVFLCGDVGIFTRPDRVDSEARKRAVTNPCELEYLTHWAAPETAPWLASIFKPLESGGLGLSCPVVMIHGEQDDFELLAVHAEKAPPPAPVFVGDLPTVDPGGFVRYLPSGWRCRLPSGKIAGAIGGIEKRRFHENAALHPRAFIEPGHVDALMVGGPLDLLLTHQGPASAQGQRSGAHVLDALREANLGRVWCYSHSHGVGNIRPDLGITIKGDAPILIKQLNSPAFTMKSKNRGEPGREAWCSVNLGSSPWVKRCRPPGLWQELLFKLWRKLPDGRLVAPPLIRAIPESA